MPIITPPDPDERLLTELAAMYDQLDPVPDVVSEAARAAFILRDLDRATVEKGLRAFAESARQQRAVAERTAW